ncbi:hypothetical protein IWZ00DRAFT_489464 [Phyllosticta capitalensis]
MPASIFWRLRGRLTASAQHSTARNLKRNRWLLFVSNSVAYFMESFRIAKLWTTEGVGIKLSKFQMVVCVHKEHSSIRRSRGGGIIAHGSIATRSDQALALSFVANFATFSGGGECLGKARPSTWPASCGSLLQRWHSERLFSRAASRTLFTTRPTRNNCCPKPPSPPPTIVSRNPTSLRIGFRPAHRTSATLHRRVQQLLPGSLPARRPLDNACWKSTDMGLPLDGPPLTMPVGTGPQGPDTGSPLGLPNVVSRLSSAFIVVQPKRLRPISPSDRLRPASPVCHPEPHIEHRTNPVPSTADLVERLARETERSSSKVERESFARMALALMDKKRDKAGEGTGMPAPAQNEPRLATPQIKRRVSTPPSRQINNLTGSSPARELPEALLLQTRSSAKSDDDDTPEASGGQSERVVESVELGRTAQSMELGRDTPLIPPNRVVQSVEVGRTAQSTEPGRDTPRLPPNRDVTNATQTTTNQPLRRSARLLEKAQSARRRQ